MGSMLALSGLISGLLVDLVIHFSGAPGLAVTGVVGVLNLPGCLFGIAMIACFRKTSIYKAIAFIVVSDLAYYIAFIAAIFAGAPFATNNGWNSSPGLLQSTVSSFAGGILGALIVAIGFNFLISRIYGKYGFWVVTLVGGILGIVGFMPGFLLGGNFDNSYLPNFLLLFPIWQVGVAIALNYCVRTLARQTQSLDIPAVASNDAL